MPEEGPNRDYDILRPTYPAEEHSLPFRTIFQEYRARRRSEIEAAIANHVPLGWAPRSTAGNEYLWAALDSYLAASEAAYAALAATKEVVQSIEQKYGETDEQFCERKAFGYRLILKAEEDCKKYDLPLKRCCTKCKRPPFVFQAAVSVAPAFRLVSYKPWRDSVSVDHFRMVRSRCSTVSIIYPRFQAAATSEAG